MAKKTSGLGVAEKPIEKAESWEKEVTEAEHSDDFDFDDLLEDPNEEQKPPEQSSDEEEELSEERNGQGILPGTKYANPEIVAAARDYADFRDLRMDYQRQEKKKLEYLTALMDKKEIEELHDGDVHITAARTRKFKVKIGDGNDSDEVE